MSHFSVLVLTKENGPDVEELLAPYDENLECDLHIEFTRQHAIDYARENYPDFKDKTDEECWKYMSAGYTTDEEGNLCSDINPDARWDWWVIGGRFENMLRLKGSNKRVDSAKIKDIDFSPDEDEYKKALRFWDIVVEHEPLKKGEKKPFAFFKEDFYREFYGDRETYAKRMASFTTQAVITPDGVWHERGSVGWFGTSSETPEEAKDWDSTYISRFIENVNPDTIVTVVDCHI